jgi:hypothetical protein
MAGRGRLSIMNRNDSEYQIGTSFVTKSLDLALDGVQACSLVVFAAYFLTTKMEVVMMDRRTVNRMIEHEDFFSYIYKLFVEGNLIADPDAVNHATVIERCLMTKLSISS